MKHVIVIVFAISLLGAGCITDSGSDGSHDLIGQWKQINGYGEVTFRADGSYSGSPFGNGTYTTSGNTLKFRTVSGYGEQAVASTKQYEYYQDGDFLTVVMVFDGKKSYNDYTRTRP